MSLPWVYVGKPKPEQPKPDDDPGIDMGAMGLKSDAQVARRFAAELRAWKRRERP